MKKHILSNANTQETELFSLFGCERAEPMLFILRAVRYTLLNGDSDTLYFPWTRGNKKCDQHSQSFSQILDVVRSSFHMHESMCSQCNNTVAFIKVHCIQIKNKVITFILMICMHMFTFLSWHGYYHGNCKTNVLFKKPCCVNLMFTH